MRLLIILKDYPPNSSPNGYLTKMLVDELQLQHDDIDVDIITARINAYLPATEHTGDSVTVYRLLTRRERYLNIIYRYQNTSNILLKNLLRLYLHFTRDYVERHNRDIYRHIPASDVYKLAKKLHKEKPYDAVLSVSYPFEAHYPAAMFKRKFKDVHWSLCLMEPHADNTAVFGSEKNKKIREAIRQENKMFSYADSIITSEPIIKHAVYSEINKYKDKLYTIYGKNLYNRTAENKTSQDGRLHVVFSGHCIPTRDPRYIMRMWQYIDDNIVLHVYAGGEPDILNDIKKIASERENIVFHGYVPFSELEEAHGMADAFVNMGWFVNNMIPSKIFDYMSFGKPIVNLYSIEGDTSNAFLKLYPSSLCLKVREEDIKLNAEKITEFILQNKHKQMSYEEIRESLGDINLEGGADRFYRIISGDESIDKIQKIDW